MRNNRRTGENWVASNGIEFLAESREFHSVRTNTRAHAVSSLMGIGAYFPEDKGGRSEGGYTLPTSGKVKKVWVYASTPPYVFMGKFPVRYIICIMNYDSF
jgi:hypothetical protein